MSLTSIAVPIQFAGNGATTVFAFPYKFLANTDLVVETTIVGIDTTKVLNVDYTVAGAGISSGGSVTFAVAPATGTTITIYRDTARNQQVDYVTQDNFPAETHETALDKGVMQNQDLGAQVARSIRLPRTQAAFSPLTKNTWASKAMHFDINGRPTPGDIVSATTIVTGDVLERASYAAARLIPAALLSVGKQIKIGGYSSAGDGGAGIFTATNVNPGADNNGTILAITAGGWWLIRNFNGAAHVRWFGAKGDGATDDTAAFTAALAASLAVIMDEGRFYVGANTVALTRVGASLKGTGRGSVIVAAAASADGVIQLNGAAAPAIRLYGQIEGFGIEGGGVSGLRFVDVANFNAINIYIGTGFTQGIDLEGALVGSFLNVSSEANVTGIKMSTGTYSSSNLIQFHSCIVNSNTSRAVWCVEGTGLLFTGCDFENNGTPGQAESCLQFDDLDTIGVQPGITFLNCWFENNKSDAAELYGEGASVSAGAVLLGNKFYSTAVRYNVRLVSLVTSMYGNGMNPSLSVGTFGTNSFNVSFGAATRGANWSNVAIYVEFDATSECSYQDPSGRMTGQLNISNSGGKIRLFIDSVTAAEIYPSAGNILFDGPVGSTFSFNRQLWSTLATNVVGNFAPIRSNGGILAFKDIVSFGKFMKDGASISVTGSKASGAALVSLLNALVSTGLITDNTTA